MQRKHINKVVFLCMIAKACEAKPYSGTVNVIDDALKGTVPIKLLYSIVDVLDDKRLIEWGTSPRCCWLEQKGKDIVAAFPVTMSKSMEELAQMLVMLPNE